MKSLDQARAVVAGSTARRVLTNAQGGIVVSPTSTHLLAQRAKVEWFDLAAETNLTRWSV